MDPKDWLATAGSALEGARTLAKSAGLSVSQAEQVVNRVGKAVAKVRSASGAWTPAPAGFGSGDTRFVPAQPQLDVRDVESPSTWGFADTRFEVSPDGSVQLTGSRYALCGQKLPNLLPWIRDVMQLELEPSDRNPWHYPPQIDPPRESPKLLAELEAMLGPEGLTQDPVVRLRHGHGHTQEEMYLIKHGKLPRVPDVVVFPTGHEQVEELVSMALRHDAVLVPFGGGTNVTDALRCPTREQRTIVSVDMRRMNRILWIDPVNRMACIEAGAVGRHIMSQLAEHGLTMGHEPDSVEFSTLGGWIATHASGMKKNRYGNIEDIVLDVTAVTAAGTMARTGLAPRESTGVDPRLMLLGSEGRLGIITSAVVKLFPLPEVQNYGSILFPDFESGVAFMYDLGQTGTLPASVRLVDNMQFQFSMALKPASEGWRARKSKLEKLYVTKLRGFDPQKMVACTLVFEGSRREVEAQEALVYAIAKQHGGLPAGGENGARGYTLTFGIAYIRDFVMDHWVLAESFETSVPWSRAIELCENVKRRLNEEHTRRGLPGRPFITCRVTQIYDTGVCIYFYFAHSYKGVSNPTETYLELERIARDEILRCGGSLSHHHGVGKLRSGYLPQIMSPAALAFSRDTKRAVDPQGVFGCGNQVEAIEAAQTGHTLEAPAPASRKSARPARRGKA